MELIENNIDISQEMNNTNQKFTYSEANEKLTYLYPNGHRITHQMRWFKGSRDRGFRADKTA